ncbi:MAG TPA: rhomboid family intramembrane serine protease [Candidatus Paceibacterota bacterium]|nr:rhomboid family intramembrane serine protease [Verrucomicrobiota bacterium]HSA10021.1 rhomboid family intramembrane serine protease [Candidatus Paceibacterota bacterium]
MRSQRQAMDWSLVLVSQGIETAIDQAEDGTGWGLVVARREYEHALKTLRQYRLENRGWPWQQPVFGPGLLFDWGSLAWVLLACLFFWLTPRTGLQSIGVMDWAEVSRGQWWRLFTAVWLHADLAHLATNSALGLLLLGLTMGRYGTGAGLLAAYLAGAGGNLLAGFISLQTHRSLGASGMVMGSLGLLAVQSFSVWRQTFHAWKFALGGICGGVMLFVLLALTPGTDVMAHLGGFVCGLLLGALLNLCPSVAQKSNANLVGGLAFALLIIVPWWLALRGGTL